MSEEKPIIEFDLDRVIGYIPSRNIFSTILREVAPGLYGVYIRGYNRGLEDGENKEKKFHSQSEFGVCVACKHYDGTGCLNPRVLNYSRNFSTDHDFGCNRWEKDDSIDNINEPEIKQCGACRFFDNVECFNSETAEMALGKFFPDKDFYCKNWAVKGNKK